MVDLHEFEAALDLLGPTLEKVQIEAVNAMGLDPDFALIRDHPRFKAMVAAAKARLAHS